MENVEVKNKYNEKINKNKKYEEGRWFSNDIQKFNYETTKDAVTRFLDGFSKIDCVELGPGHGTWTEFILKQDEKARIDFVDISSEMLKILKERFGDKQGLRFFESDFLKYKSDKKYSVFFSSRAIEYINDREGMAAMISELMDEGGLGFVITKTPHYLRIKILGKKISDFHKGQLTPQELKRLLGDKGLQIEYIHPVTFSWPFWKSVKMNQLLFKIFGGKEINCVSQFFSESYAVKFSKK
ncbi:hypothetical protein C0583_03730 [Candidatus Parcubacteria bacterium]|nr:MAG: hypothetical protein C0583_03730 [Candidatus Parcubacteria bacterium]